MTSQSAVVKLNIGGQVFRTKKSTLKKSDGFFKALLETSIPVIKDGEECVTIHRDPKWFSLILNFLRFGVVKLPSSMFAVEEIHNEANFYLLSNLMAMCEERMSGIEDCYQYQEPKSSLLRTVLSPTKILAALRTILNNYKEEIRRKTKLMEKSYGIRRV